MIPTLVEEIKFAAQRIWNSPMFAATVLALGMSMTLLDNVQCEECSAHKMVLLVSQRAAASAQRIKGYGRTFGSVPQSGETRKPLEIGFGWDARMTHDGPVLSVTLVLPGYTGYFSTSDSDSRA